MRHRIKTFGFAVYLIILVTGITNTFWSEFHSLKSSGMNPVTNESLLPTELEGELSVFASPAIASVTEATDRDSLVIDADPRKAPPPIPEPGTMVLLGLSLITAAGYMRKVNKR
jgi:hypothetical protein